MYKGEVVYNSHYREFSCQMHVFCGPNQGFFAESLAHFPQPGRADRGMMKTNAFYTKLLTQVAKMRYNANGNVLILLTQKESSPCRVAQPLLT
jgi:hypothetical protein